MEDIIESYATMDELEGQLGDAFRLEGLLYRSDRFSCFRSNSGSVVPGIVNRCLIK